MPETDWNRCNFDAAVELLNLRYGGIGCCFHVGACYKDFGRSEVWVTIINERKGSDCQFLYPAEWDALNNASYGEGVAEVVDKLGERLLRTGY